MTIHNVLKNKIFSEESGKMNLANHPNVKRKIQDSRDQFLNRAFLINYFGDKTQGSYQKLDNIADSLRKFIPIKTYPEHLNLLFAEN
ncbi:MAG TPA: hypothetical protein EYM60_01065 [Candidatus Marinimicrobia bacterium]|nr:hypothetical protein [Candidatus Neomarinimicrobiota bacterium]